MTNEQHELLRQWSKAAVDKAHEEARKTSEAINQSFESRRPATPDDDPFGFTKRERQGCWIVIAVVALVVVVGLCVSGCSSRAAVTDREAWFDQLETEIEVLERDVDALGREVEAFCKQADAFCAQVDEYDKQVEQLKRP